MVGEERRRRRGERRRGEERGEERRGEQERPEGDQSLQPSVRTDTRLWRVL